MGARSLRALAPGRGLALKPTVAASHLVTLDTFLTLPSQVPSGKRRTGGGLRWAGQSCLSAWRALTPACRRLTTQRASPALLRSGGSQWACGWKWQCLDSERSSLCDGRLSPCSWL